MPCEIPKLDRDQPHIVASVRVTPANATSYVTYTASEENHDSWSPGENLKFILSNEKHSVASLTPHVPAVGHLGC